MVERLPTMNEAEVAPDDCRKAPTWLSYYLVGWPPPGPSSFEWGNGALRVLHDGGYLSFVPNGDDWAAFWKACDEVDVWSWPAEVGDLAVCDGGVFKLELELDSRAVVSRGQLAGSPPEFASALMTLHQALQALVGWDGSDNASGGPR